MLPEVEGRRDPILTAESTRLPRLGIAMFEWQAVGFQIVNGLVWSLIVALIALGLNAMFGLLGLLNMAHGSLYTLGAILALVSLEFLSSFWIAALIVPVAIALAAIPLYHLVLRRTIGQEMMIGLLATSGLLFVIDDTALALFGGGPRSMPAPTTGIVELLGFHYPVYRFLAAGAAAAVLLLFYAFLRFTSMGIWIRCVAQSQDLAKACGVPVERVYLVVVCLGTYFAALAGVLAAPMTLVHYQMGLGVLGPAFIVIVVGGLGNLAGAVIAAMIIGVGRGVLTVFFPPTYADVLAIAGLLPLLVVRPNGIFGSSS
jgi:branched-chain amino acid transport system permease protein